MPMSDAACSSKVDLQRELHDARVASRLNLTITRAFKLGGERVQFRWEIFNLINHVNLNAPVTALNSASFGQIQTAGDPRIMQFALKVDF